LFRTLIQLADSLKNRDVIATAIQDMKDEVGKPSFLEKYNTFIQSISKNITIFAPFIPMLTTFLTK